jgi:lipopolysaccharide heptosyltransferase III
MTHEPRKFLIFAKPAIGDILLATPLFRSIRASEPDATIDVMCYPGQEGILEGNPDINSTVVISPKPALRELIATFRRLFRKYDVAITNAADDRVHLYLLLLGKKRISVTLKGGPAWKRWIVDSSVEDGQHLHALLRNNRLGNVLGYPSRYEIRVPRISDSSLSSTSLHAKVGSVGPYAVIHPDARLPYKRWRNEGWSEVIRYLTKQNLYVYVTGGSSAPEREYIDALLEQMPKSVRSLAGKLSLAEAGNLLEGCRIYVGVDTVMSHMAAAVGAPTVALFGPESPIRWGPWPVGYAEDRSPWDGSGTNTVENVRIVQARDPCPSCTVGACVRRRDHDTPCRLMSSIRSDQVIDGIRQMLSLAQRQKDSLGTRSRA